MYRIGNARDIHKLVEGRKLFLGTVEIPFEKGLLGHSDGDCVTHAIVNAIIGAMGLGDIGKFFPDNDPKYKDISSSYFLQEIKKVLLQNKYEIHAMNAELFQNGKPTAKWKAKSRLSLGWTMGKCSFSFSQAGLMAFIPMSKRTMK